MADDCISFKESHTRPRGLRRIHGMALARFLALSIEGMVLFKWPCRRHESTCRAIQLADAPMMGVDERLPCGLPTADDALLDPRRLDAALEARGVPLLKLLDRTGSRG